MGINFVEWCKGLVARQKRRASVVLRGIGVCGCKRRVARVGGSVLAFILIGVSTARPVLADSTTSSSSSGDSSSTSLSTSMIQYFRTGNALQTASITNSEMRVFGAFVSNFYKPGSTQIGQLASNSSLVTQLDNIFFPGDSSGAHANDIKTLLTYVDTAWKQDSSMVMEDSGGKTGTTLHSFLNSHVSLNSDGTVASASPVYADNKQGAVKPVFWSGDKKQVQTCVSAVVLSAMANTSAYNATFSPSGTSEGSQDNSALSVDPFGDITIASGKDAGMVVVPACLNPYTFYQTYKGSPSTQLRFPINNAFVLGSITPISKNTLYVKSGDKLKPIYALTDNNLGVLFSSIVSNGFGVTGFRSLEGKYYLKMDYRGKVKSIPQVTNEIPWMGSTWSTNYALKEADDSDNASIVDDFGYFANQNAFKGSSNNILSTSLYSNVGSSSTAAGDPGEPAGFWDTTYSSILEASGVDFQNPTFKVKDTLAKLKESFDLGDAILNVDGEMYKEPTYAEMSKIFSSKGRVNSAAKINTAAFYTINSDIATLLSSNSITYSNDSINVAASACNFWGGIYWGYLDSLLGAATTASQSSSDSSSDNGGGPFEYTGSNLPNLDIGLLSNSFSFQNELQNVTSAKTSQQSQEQEQSNIISEIFQLLTPSHQSYRTNLVKATFDDTILSVHNSLVGSDFVGVSNVGSASSSTTYQGSMGYVTTPQLSELPFTSWVIDNYIWLYFALMIFVLVVAVFMLITHFTTVKRILILFFTLSFVLILPKTVIDGTIALTNGVSAIVYGNRFTYWALQQQQSSANSVANAGNATSANLLQTLETSYYQTEDNGVRLKWMAPKRKTTITQLLSNNLSTTEMMNTSIFRWLFAGIVQNAVYVNDPNASYLYRSYVDIANEGSQLASITGKDTSTSTYSAIPNKISSAWNTMYSEDTVTDPAHRQSNTGNGKFLRLLTTPTSSTVYGKNHFDQVRPKSLSYDYITSAVTNNTVNNAVFDPVMRDDASPGIGLDLSANTIANKSGNMSSEDLYLNYSSNVYYYFYNVFANEEAYVQTADGSYQLEAGTNKFHELLLSDDFYKSEQIDNNGTPMRANGQIKDFMNLEGLFTFIIPYLNYSNAYVKKWTGEFGSSAENIDENTYKAATSNSQYQQAVTHKADLGNVWNMYSPWVDTIYNESYIYNQHAGSVFNTQTIFDSMNPDSYNIEDRPMLFSPASMALYGADTTDLTPVEQKIMKTEEDTYRDLLYLNNYNGFDENSLISAAAMIATFNFNKNFSENHLFSESHNLYPINFELNNMNFDGFMRMIIMNATGEPLNSSDGSSVYERVMNKSSVLTGLALIAEDGIAIYAIPTVKIVLLMFILALALVLLIYCILSPVEKLLKVILRVFFLPLALFAVLLIAHAMIISLFIGSGLSNLVGEQSPSIVTNDPGIILGLMILTDVVFIVLMIKVLLMVFKSLKTYGKGVGAFVFGLGAVAGSALSSIGTGVKKVGKGAFKVGTWAYHKHKSNKASDLETDRHDSVIKNLSGINKNTGSINKNTSDINKNTQSNQNDAEKEKSEVNKKASYYTRNRRSQNKNK